MQAATLATVLVSYLVIQGTIASHFKAYEKPNFEGNIHEIKSCGCWPLHYQGSYKWHGEQHEARAFNTQDCQGGVNELKEKGKDGERASPVGFVSVKIYC